LIEGEEDGPGVSEEGRQHGELPSRQKPIPLSTSGYVTSPTT